MRRYVPFLIPTLIALVSTGLLVAAQRSKTLQTQIERIEEADWLKAIVSRGPEVAEVPS
jgi:hypothetical protein